MGDGSPEGMGCKAATPHMGWMPNGAGMALQSGGGGEVDTVQNKPACRKEAESAPPPSPIPSIGIAAYGAARWGQWDREVSSGIAVHGVGNRNQLRTWKRNLRPTAQPVPCHDQDPPPPPPPRRSPPSRRAQHPKEGQPPLPTPLTPPCSTTSVQ